MAVTQYIGARYVPLFATPLEWDNTKTYEPLTIVIHNGNSYTSRQSVPTGIDITNENYWALTGNYNSQIEQYRTEVKGISKEVSETKDTANNAKTSADNAVTTANSAKTSADNASTKVDTYDNRIKEIEKVGVKLNSNKSNTEVTIDTTIDQPNFRIYNYLLITCRVGTDITNYIYKTVLLNTKYILDIEQIGPYAPENVELTITKAFDNELVIYSSYWNISTKTITAQSNKTYTLSQGSTSVTKDELYIVDVRGIVFHT